LGDTRSPVTAAQWTTDSPLLSPVRGLPQLTPPWVGQPGESTTGTPTPSDVMPTPREAARRLARFTEEVQLKRQSPLIASPPRQKMTITRQSLPIRSRRIAAQPLARIPTSKQGKVLLMQKMGIVPPAAPISSTSKGTYYAIFAGKLMPSHMAALDELFPATNNRAGRRALFSDGRVESRS
jgi:hypothetical protein